ncbi:unnamed protein product, partial [Mesorhabditis spiculigera]
MASTEALPTHFDVIILGTGLPETIMAAACAQAGKTVLHLDRRNYYGGDWASFSLHTARSEWFDALTRPATPPLPDGITLEEGEQAVMLGCECAVRDFSDEGTILEQCGPSAANILDDALDKYRKIRRVQFDLMPKVLTARDAMVKALLSSGVSKYLEFKPIRKVLFEPEPQTMAFEPIPLTKNQISSTDRLKSLIDRRRFMKFLEFCTGWNATQDPALLEEYCHRPLGEFLTRKYSMGAETQALIHGMIALMAPQPTTLQGLTAICLIMDSVGVYCPSPFLFPEYGCGELPQAFARNAAVFGAIYKVGYPIDHVVTKEGRLSAVLIEEGKINCDVVFSSPEYVPREWRGIEEGDVKKRIYRSIVISNEAGNQLVDKEADVALTSFGDQGSSRLMQMGHRMTAPGYFVTHLIADDEESIRKAESRLFPDTPLPYKLRFSLPASTDFEPGPSTPSNFHVLPGIDRNLDYIQVLEKVRHSFSSIFPGVDFLPTTAASSRPEDPE